jgi:predicted DNA-binding transcriptional regulator AlpA
MTILSQPPEQATFLTQSAVLATAIPEFPMSLSTLARLAAKGDFPAPVKIGGRSFWDPAAIAEWKAARILDARTRSTKPQSKE